MSHLSADGRREARLGAMRFSRRVTPEPDLLAELEERMNDLSRFEASLAVGDFTDGDEGQLRGGIAYERYHIEAIVAELEARERARVNGYRPAVGMAERDLPGRFAAARSTDAADIIRVLTGQLGQRYGDRWRFSCPFHADDTPSLTAYPGERGWYCFSCGAGGDAVRFIMEHLCIGAVEALRLLEAGAVGARVTA